MSIHKNARLTPLRREEMARDVVEGRVSKAHAARIYGVTAKVVARWVGRFLAEGSVGMIDRSSRPKTSPKRTEAAVADAIAAPAAPDRQAHRHGDRRVRGDGEPGAGTRRPVAAERPGTGRAGAPL